MTFTARPSRAELILASSSPRRQELVALLGLPYRVLPSGASEETPADWTPDRIVEELSLRKANAVREEHSFAPGDSPIIVGSDTIVVLDGAAMGKPSDEQDARRMLGLLSGRTHEVYTGVACVSASREPADAAGGDESIRRLGETGRYRILSASPEVKTATVVGHSVSKVTFRPMSEEEIRGYARTGEPSDKAGAYGIQGIGSVFVEKIEGDFYAIMGLPLNLLYRMLSEFGASPFGE